MGFDGFGLVQCERLVSHCLRRLSLDSLEDRCTLFGASVQQEVVGPSRNLAWLGWASLLSVGQCSLGLEYWVR